MPNDSLSSMLQKAKVKITPSEKSESGIDEVELRIKNKGKNNLKNDIMGQLQNALKNRRMRNGRRTRRIFPKRFLHLPRGVPNNTSESNKKSSFQSVKESSEDMFENKEKLVIENPSEIPRNTSGHNIYIKDIYQMQSDEGYFVHTKGKPKKCKMIL